MGQFDFVCCDCEYGEDGFDSRDYFGSSVRIDVKMKNGDHVVLSGEYTGYGTIEACGETFYPVQFAKYFKDWSYTRGVEELPTYVAERIWCNKCMANTGLSSFCDWDLSKFYTVQEYDTYGGYKPKTPVIPPVIPTPVHTVKKQAVKAVKAVKAVQPKLKKTELAELLLKKDAELTTLKEENICLKKREERYKEMERNYVKITELNEHFRNTLTEITKTCHNVGIY